MVKNKLLKFSKPVLIVWVSINWTYFLGQVCCRQWRFRVYFCITWVSTNGKAEVFQETSQRQGRAGCLIRGWGLSVAMYQTFLGLGSQNFPYTSRIASKSQLVFLCPVIGKLAQCLWPLHLHLPPERTHLHLCFLYKNLMEMTVN